MALVLYFQIAQTFFFLAEVQVMTTNHDFESWPLHSPPQLISFWNGLSLVNSIIQTSILVHSF